jgi:hypothetical protein
LAIEGDTSFLALKGDTAAIILYGAWRQNCTYLNFRPFFCQLSESENVWPSAMATFAVVHVEKDDQVKRRLGKHKLHNNNKVIQKALLLSEN